MVSHSLGNAKICERFDVQLEEQEEEEKTKCLEHGSTPLALMWVVWRERNRRTFEGVESSLSQLRSRLLSCRILPFGVDRK